MTDTQIIDWIERHVESIQCPMGGGVMIKWFKKGREKKTTGEDLRDAVKKANGLTLFSRESSG